MTILHLIVGLQVGGAEVQLLELARRSDGDEFCHIVVSLMSSTGPIADDLRSCGIQVYSLDMPKSKLTLRGFRKLLSLIRQLRPDVLHCWMYHACLVGLVASRFSRNSRLVWGLRAAHGGLSDYAFSTRIVIRLCAVFSEVPEFVVLNAYSSIQVHKDLGFKTGKMRVIPNGVDEFRFSPDLRVKKEVRSELGIAENESVVGLSARYDPMKDHATFLRAARIVLARFPKCRFVLLGSQVDGNNHVLKQLVRDNSLEPSVILLGERRDVHRLYASFDIACLSSWTESFPNVVIEAMSVGVPCVVADVGDCRAVVGNTGVVVPPRDPVALADGICSLLADGEERLTKLGTKARERVLERFTLARMTGDYESLYQGNQQATNPRDPVLCSKAH